MLFERLSSPSLPRSKSFRSVPCLVAQFPTFRFQDALHVFFALVVVLQADVVELLEDFLRGFILAETAGRVESAHEGGRHRGLQFEHLVQILRLRFLQFLRSHGHDEPDGGVGVVLFVVSGVQN